MAKHDVADAVRTATIDGEIGAYTREHVPPPGVVGERRGGAFEVSRDPDAERGVAPLLTLVSVLGGMATAYLASKHVRSAPDMQRFVGAAGSAWLALPIAVIGSTPAFLGAAALGPDRRPA